MPAALPDQLVDAILRAQERGLVVRAAEATREGKKTTVRLDLGDGEKLDSLDLTDWSDK